MTTTGYSYGGHASPAWQSAELEVEVARAPGGTSVLRADAVVRWPAYVGSCCHPPRRRPGSSAATTA